MGSEDLFHKRKARSAQDSARDNSKRQSYDKILVVCEGEKTEPIYFEEIRVVLGIDFANIEIDGSCGSSPINVVNRAYLLHREALQSGDSYNRVFCVFDKDSHTTFEEAIERINQINCELSEQGLKEQSRFEGIISIPSFEYWFLLHYNPTTKPYAATPTKSVGDHVIDDLKKYLPGYKKTQKGLFSKSQNEGTLEGALANSRRIYKASLKSGNINPSTNVHELIEYLRDVKKTKN